MKRNLATAVSDIVELYQESSARQQHATRGLPDEVPRDTAQHPLAKPGMAIGTGNHDPRFNVRSDAIDLLYRVSAGRGHLGTSHNTVARQPFYDVRSLVTHCFLVALPLGNARNCHFLCFSEQRQRIGGRTPRFRAIFPGDQRTAKIGTRAAGVAGRHARGLRAPQRAALPGVNVLFRKTT